MRFLPPLYGLPLHRAESEADCQCFIDVPHGFFVERAHFLAQAAFVQRADLLGQDDGILGQSVVRRTDRDMRRHFRLVDLRCNSGGDHGRTLPIADVVLHDQHRTDAALLTANHRTEIGIVNIASFDVAIHFGSHSDEIDLRCCLMVFPQTYFPRVTQNYNCIMQKSGERKISSASKLSRNYSFADKQERTAGRSKVVRKFLFRNFLPPEVQKG